ncbi:esterase CG5412 isoform X1 [Athalia rosae]|uniref:esterase CG5412 isoform X1 n=1 Tax=Athalia rosae TaxID=37344 RepID=UPI002033CA8A|nr:esterase CG5412 isoform X1 [Athalia rosae]
MAGENVKLRILALHGFFQSDSAFRVKTGAFRKPFKKNVDFTYVCAPHKILRTRPNADNNTDANAEEFGWWFNNSNTEFKATNRSPEAVGFQESVQMIERIFKEQGPFDGILGFSQGAAFAAILCAMQQKKLSSIRFNFAVMISGFKSRCESHSVFYTECLDIPSLHVYGTGDQIVPPEMPQELTKLFANPITLTHVGGHYVPGDKNLYKEFLEKMLFKKNNPDSR